MTPAPETMSTFPLARFIHDSVLRVSFSGTIEYLNSVTVSLLEYRDEAPTGALVQNVLRAEPTEESEERNRKPRLASGHRSAPVASGPTIARRGACSSRIGTIEASRRNSS